MGMEPFVGEVMVFAGNFAPRGYSLCDGRLLPINQYTAVFSLLGTTYGGDGRSTFAVPDMRGRYLMSAGAGPGLSPRELGEAAGTETTTITLAQLPAHIHPLAGQSSTATGNIPKTAVTISSTSTANCASTGGNSNPNGAYPGDGGSPSWGAPADGTMASDMVTTVSSVTADIPISVNVTLSGNTGSTGASQPVPNMPPFLAIYYCIALEGVFPSRP